MPKGPPWNPFGKREESLHSLLQEAAEALGIQVRTLAGEQAELDIDGEKITASLRNVQIQLREAPPGTERDVVRTFLSSIANVARMRDKPFDVVRPRLVPRVGGPLGELRQRVPSHVLVPDFLEVNLAVDDPGFAWYVEHRHLETWGASYEALTAAVMDNLRARTQRSALQPVPSFPGVLACLAEDSFAASRILLLKDLVTPWPGEGVVVTVPTREHLLCVRLEGKDFPLRLKWMVEGARLFYLHEQHPISDQAFWFDGAIWERVPVRYEDRKTIFTPSDRFAQAMVRAGAMSPPSASLSGRFTT